MQLDIHHERGRRLLNDSKGGMRYSKDMAADTKQST